MAHAAASRLTRDNPWPGLEQFGEGDAQYFHGRDPEAAELLRMVRRQSLTVLYGRSGLGKTSLLSAGLFPRLRKSDFVPVHIRLDFSGGGPALRSQVFDRLLAECAEQGIEAQKPLASETLWEYFHRTDVEFWNERNRPVTPALAFDQLEEAFTRGLETETARSKSREFITELGDLIEGRVPARLQEILDESPDIAARFDFGKAGLVVILSFREDFLPDFEGLKNQIPSLMHNRFRLQPMNGQQAHEVVIKGGGHLVDEDIARRIIAIAAGRETLEHLLGAEHYEGFEIDPALLSVICSELNARRQRAGLSKITADLVSGAEREILSDFYERSVAGLAPQVRVFVEDELLTDKGYRDSYAFDDAIALPGITEEALDTLVARRLVRLDQRFGVRRLELAHDVLTRVVRESRDSRALREEKLAAQERERLQRRRLRYALGTAVLLFSVALTFAWLWIRVELQNRVILSQRLTADSRALLASRGDLGLLLALEANRVGDTTEARDLLLSLESLIDPRLYRYFSLGDQPAGPVAFSPDGKLLAAASLRSIVLWDWDDTGQPVGEPLTGHKDIVTGIAFSPDGRLIASASRNGSIMLWDVVARKPVGRPLVDHEGPVLCLAFSPDGMLLVSGDEHGAILVWDVATRKALGPPLMEHGEQVTSVAFSPDGHVFVSASPDGKLILWDRASLRQIGIPLQQRGVTVAAFNRDGKIVAAGSTDGSVVLWDVGTRKRIPHALSGHHDAVTTVGFGADDQLASGAADGSMILWDVSSSAPQHESLAASPESVTGLAFSADGKMLARASGDTVALFNRSANPLHRMRLVGHTQDVTGIAFNAKGNTLASIGQDGRVQLWDMHGRQPLGRINPVGREVPLGVNYGTSGLIVASLDQVGELRVRRYDAEGGTPRSLGTWQGQTPLVRFSADGSIVAIRALPVEDDGTPAMGAPSVVELRDTALGASAGTAIQSMSGMALSPDGKTVAVTKDETSIAIVSALTNRVLVECITDQEAHVSPWAFSPDGRRLAVLGEDSAELGAWTVVQCDTATGKTVGAAFRLREVNDLAFSPDGRRIATASDTPPFVALWDAATGKFAGELFLSERNNKQNTMYALAFSPDGKSLAVANNNEVLLADLDIEAKKARMCRIVNRNLTRGEWKKYLGDRAYEPTCPRVPAAGVRP